MQFLDQQKRFPDEALCCFDQRQPSVLSVSFVILMSTQFMLSRFPTFLRSLTVRLVTTVSLVSWAIQPSLSQTEVPELPEEPWTHDWPSRIEPLPPAPQYDSLVHWACHPFKNDKLLPPKADAVSMRPSSKRMCSSFTQRCTWMGRLERRRVR